MQFFKHYNSASDSEFLQLVVEKYGLIRYAHWFRLLELLCKHFDGESILIRLTRKEIIEKLKIKPSSVDEIIGQFVLLDPKQAVIKLPGKGQLVPSYELPSDYLGATENLVIIIEAPILIDLQDRDFKRARKDRALPAPKNKTKNKNKEEEKRDDFVHPLDLPHSDKLTPEKIVETWNDGCEQFGMPKIFKLNDQRKKKLKNFMNDVKTLEEWQNIFLVASTKSFVGKDGRKFTPNFDYVLEKGRHLSLLEESKLVDLPEPEMSEADAEKFVRNYMREQGVAL